MKKSSYVLLFMMLLVVGTKAQTTWIAKNLDEKISVKFPAEPEKLAKNNAITYMLKTKDSVKYAAVMVNLKISANLDSATLAQLKDNQQFADQMVQGIASQKPNYTFEEVKIGNWKNYTSYDFSGLENKTKGILIVKMILIGSKMYSFSYLVPANLQSKNKEMFFGSIDLVK